MSLFLVSVFVFYFIIFVLFWFTSNQMPWKTAAPVPFIRTTFLAFMISLYNLLYKISCLCGQVSCLQDDSPAFGSDLGPLGAAAGG
jgi:hypothetical protein